MKFINCLLLLPATISWFAVSCVTALALDAVAKTTVNVRTGPSSRNGKVGVLLAGDAVSVLKCKRGWCYIQHSGLDGWAVKKFLNIVEESDAGDSGPAATEGTEPTPMLVSLQEQNPCKPDYVWREIIPEDHVCVRPARRTKAQRENTIARMRIDPAGVSGSNTCRVGFVWREAYVGDVVCVSPSRQKEVARENANGPSLRAVAR